MGLGFTSPQAMPKKVLPQIVAFVPPPPSSRLRSQEVHLIMMQLLSLSSGGASQQLKSFLVDTSKGERFSLPEKRTSLGSFGISNGKLIVTLLCTTENRGGSGGCQAADKIKFTVDVIFL